MGERKEVITSLKSVIPIYKGHYSPIKISYSPAIQLSFHLIFFLQHYLFDVWFIKIMWREKLYSRTSK